MMFHFWLSSTKRQYPPVALKTLQLLIDTGRLDASKPIDLAAIANTKVVPINPDFHHFGVNLTDEV
jgi:large subunit ribosomal protein L15